MSRHMRARAHPLIPLLLAAIACQDPTDPRPVKLQPQFAQGDNGTWTVNSLADPGDGVCDETDCTLREAIAAAPSGGTILFQPGLQGTILLTAGQLTIDGPNFQIDGGGRITVDAQGNSRVFGINGSNTTLTGLTLQHGRVGVGAGLRVSASAVTLDRVTVADNESIAEAAGIYNDDSEITIRNSTISGNRADGLGGGLRIRSRFSTRIINSTLSANQGIQGGGLYVDAGPVEIRGTTISGNHATSIGGAITNGNPASDSPAGGDITVTSSTIVANSAATHTGGVVNGGGGASLILANSILAANAGGDCAGPSSGLSSAGYNLTTDCTFDLTEPTDLLVPPAQFFTQVLEPALEDNGGPTKTHALIARGRAVDAGYCPGETTDQRGFGRPVDDPVMPNALDACDIGAYELQGPVAAVADLMISQAANKTSVKQGELLTYSIRVQNLGPETAPNVVVTDVLPTGATFVEARHNKGSHTAPPSGETGTVTWTVGDMLDEANEVAEITVTVRVRGRTSITNTASVTGDVADPNEANNSAALRVSVVSGTSGKGGSKK